jgi:hypothetical protein
MLDALIRPLLLIAIVTAAAGPWFVIAVLRPAFGRSGLSEEGRWLGRLWPLFVFLLGLQMFLFYKEI